MACSGVKTNMFRRAFPGGGAALESQNTLMDPVSRDLKNACQQLNLVWFQANDYT